ncbi:hypothetical protein CAOG_07620 [Capsaspora owczarzaki ATCC 30864]|uniref:SAYSvFN domain-containing protein n=1 Tax=Capsaspora owczarzaki (strain ATCC 30864) TaxID=595528 RepID=A0A0D2WW61_CAPO3|nr:hypothetical protein CAOG_07620 [Capsaspora owczarzaki ATCC 30864]KJE97170.1 hypothetical protein CAOG_007620 [Capsaspora owczarzaki ATCC 30864]|eukprot:XP_004343494.1 hypothetical protein CAOG_07620 [Capsaspora owczarzaki ATCC 30864]
MAPIASKPDPSRGTPMAMAALRRREQKQESSDPSSPPSNGAPAAATPAAAETDVLVAAWDWITRNVALATALKAVLWVLLLLIFAELEFGTVFVILSTPWLIFTNLGSGESAAERRRRDPHAKSAYSVFNKNCEPLQGELRAEQLDAALRQGRMM